MKNPDGSDHPATFQPDLCEQLTPATVAVWLRKRGLEAYARQDTNRAYALAVAANHVEKLVGDVEAAHAGPR